MDADGITLLLGGVRSGKSALAVEIGRRFPGQVVFVATAEPFDQDLRRRVDRHRAERPDWPTIECPIHLADALGAVDPTALVIVDCLTVWVATLMHHDLTLELDPLIDALSGRLGPTVLVSNEVGMGLHPETPLGRDYRDALGQVNQRVAAAADRTLLLVAGRALQLDDPWSSLR